MIVRRIERRWHGLAVVAASGPSMTEEIADAIKGHRCIAVNDAYRMMPSADVLYAADGQWWDVHKGCPEFAGERWSCYDEVRLPRMRQRARAYGLSIIRGAKKETFSLDPELIHYGRNSGFQAINLALLFGANPIILVGFDFQMVSGKRHFFGNHPRPLTNHSNYKDWIMTMSKAADALPSHIRIINCNAASALQCFEKRDLGEVLNGFEISHAA